VRTGLCVYVRIVVFVVSLQCYSKPFRSLKLKLNRGQLRQSAGGVRDGDREGDRDKVGDRDVGKACVDIVVAVW